MSKVVRVDFRKNRRTRKAQKFLDTLGGWGVVVLIIFAFFVIPGLFSLL